LICFTERELRKMKDIK